MPWKRINQSCRGYQNKRNPWSFWRSSFPCYYTQYINWKNTWVSYFTRNTMFLISRWVNVLSTIVAGGIFMIKNTMVNSIFNFIDTRKMLSVHQSGFHPFDSSVHQLILIVHDIYNSFDANPSLEVRGVFFDIFKAFDRVWHKGLLLKLNPWV